MCAQACARVCARTLTCVFRKASCEGCFSSNPGKGLGHSSLLIGDSLVSSVPKEQNQTYGKIGYFEKVPKHQKFSSLFPERATEESSAAWSKEGGFIPAIPGGWAALQPYSICALLWLETWLPAGYRATETTVLSLPAEVKGLQ